MSRDRTFRFLTLSTAMLIAAVVLPFVAKASAPGPPYLAVSSFSATAHHRHLAKLSLTTGAPIPRHPDAFIRANLVVGFGWADLDTNRAFVVTIHGGRDSRQNPRGWHPHMVTFGPGATAPNDYCFVSIDSSPTAGIQLHGATMRVNVRTRVLPFPVSAIDTAVGFTIQPDAACASGLGILIST
jgi:hypothetical protein